MLTKQYLRQYPSLYVCPFLQYSLGSEIFIDFLLVTKTLPLTLRLKLPFSIATSIRLLIFLATLVPSSPIIIWPCLVSFPSMPSRSTVIVKQKKNKNKTTTKLSLLLSSFKQKSLNEKVVSDDNLPQKLIFKLSLNVLY